MRIAFATRNGQTITSHFGRAKALIVVEVGDGRENARQWRAVDTGAAPLQIGSSPHAHDREHHDGVLAVVSDCDLVVGGGMGRPMAERIEAAGLQVLLTSERDIDTAIEALVAGTLQHEAALVHEPAH